jgi:hypothetical protein
MYVSVENVRGIQVISLKNHDHMAGETPLQREFVTTGILLTWQNEHNMHHRQNHF